MADINFIKILDILKSFHEIYPTLRFGQIIQSAVDNYKKIHNTDLHDLNSKNMIEALELYKTKLEHAKKSGRYL